MTPEQRLTAEMTPACVHAGHKIEVGPVVSGVACVVCGRTLTARYDLERTRA
jgi:hypothetical protein